MITKPHETADELAELSFAALRCSVTLVVVLISGFYLWAGELLIRLFRSYYPHRSLKLWLALSLGHLVCAVLVITLTHSLLAWLTLFGLIGLALASLALLERVLGSLERPAAPSAEQPAAHASGVGR